ncbi:hypothetical protein NBRC116601_12250 [Cognatishimia sp. WU-CL00825]|uniref:hypothetical protein n=1 Tax=Cognatishimia sp. WU-CL00825 TaxID=3127658 RepID=UPI0031036A9E
MNTISEVRFFLTEYLQTCKTMNADQVSAFWHFPCEISVFGKSRICQNQTELAAAILQSQSLYDAYDIAALRKNVCFVHVPDDGEALVCTQDKALDANDEVMGQWSCTYLMQKQQDNCWGLCKLKITTDDPAVLDQDVPNQAASLLSLS